MKKILFPLLSAVFSIIIFATCKKTEEAPAKKPPVANAGADVTIYIPTDSITLDGSASRDPDGNIIRYEWTKLSGPDSFKIVNASAVRTIVKNLKWGTYRFQLQVTDSNNLSAKDTVLIKVHGLAPIANAGADVSISLSSCSDNNGFADLDGTGSSDPYNKVFSTRWTKISGPSGFATIVNTISKKTRVENLSAGEYGFEFKMTDAEGLVSRDTMWIHAKSEVKEYDFDITLHSNYLFEDNYEDSWYGDYSWDKTTASGTGNVPPIGNFDIFLQETADTAASSDVHYTTISLIDNKGYQVNGECSINFKKLIGQGGGPINGTYKITTGSAQSCGGDVFSSLTPSTVTGNLDPSTQTVTLRVQGKLRF